MEESLVDESKITNPPDGSNKDGEKHRLDFEPTHFLKPSSECHILIVSN
jgi:hypothetical protein